MRGQIPSWVDLSRQDHEKVLRTIAETKKKLGMAPGYNNLDKVIAHGTGWRERARGKFLSKGRFQY